MYTERCDQQNWSQKISQNSQNSNESPSCSPSSTESFLESFIDVIGTVRPSSPQLGRVCLSVSSEIFLSQGVFGVWIEHRTVRLPTSWDNAQMRHRCSREKSDSHARIRCSASKISSRVSAICFIYLGRLPLRRTYLQSAIPQPQFDAKRNTSSTNLEPWLYQKRKFVFLVPAHSYLRITL